MRFAIVLIALVVACGGSSDDDPRQALYNGFLTQARSDVRNNPGQNCDPDYQDLVIEQVEGTSANKAILKLAMGDACIEAGQYSDAAQYSSYHAQAPD